MDLTNELKSVIEKNLPAAVGEQLQAVLAQGRVDAKNVADLTARNKSLTDDLQRQTNLVERMNIEAKKYGDLVAREKVIEDRERNSALREVQQDLAAEKRISAFAVDVVTKLVRNTEWRSGVLGQVPVAVAATPPTQYNANGSPAYLAQGNVNTATTGEAL